MGQQEAHQEQSPGLPVLRGAKGKQRAGPQGEGQGGEEERTAGPAEVAEVEVGLEAPRTQQVDGDVAAAKPR